jgi:hypothetical protein
MQGVNHRYDRYSERLDPPDDPPEPERAVVEVTLRLHLDIYDNTVDIDAAVKKIQSLEELYLPGSSDTIDLTDCDYVSHKRIKEKDNE